MSVGDRNCSVYLVTFEEGVQVTTEGGGKSRFYVVIESPTEQGIQECVSIPRVVFTRKRKCVTVDTLFVTTVVCCFFCFDLHIFY
jgi:hypothetical protein